MASYSRLAQATRTNDLMDAEFETQVDMHYKSVYYFALSLAKNESDAADHTQQAYLKLARNWSKIRDRNKIRSWLFSTLYREFIDRKRRGKFYADVDFEDVARETEAESLSENSIDHYAVREALFGMEDKLRVPLTLYYLEDQSYRQISEILDIPIGTVMSRLHRGKKLLYDKLTETEST